MEKLKKRIRRLIPAGREGKRINSKFWRIKIGNE